LSAELLSSTRPVIPVELPKKPKAKSPVVTPANRPPEQWIAPVEPPPWPRKAAPAAPATGPPPDILAGYLNREQLAQQLDVGFRTLERWAVSRIGPKVTHIGRAPYYAVRDIESWLVAGGTKAHQRKRPQIKRPARVGRRNGGRTA
jgi:hypothetical protein